MKRAEIRLSKDDSLASMVVKSLIPETERNIPRTRVEVREEKDAVYIDITTRDVNALRAGLNSYLRWMKVSMDTLYETRNGNR